VDQVFKRKESDMNATTVAVDLAKSVFQLAVAVADGSWRVTEKHRLTRTQFERWFANRDVSMVIMESCGSAHHWARWLTGLGIGQLHVARSVAAWLLAERCRGFETSGARTRIPARSLVCRNQLRWCNLAAGRRRLLYWTGV
jgi:transposase